MMIAQQRFGRILVYGRPVDMRNGFGGLEAVVRAGLDEDPLSGDLFVFINVDISRKSITRFAPCRSPVPDEVDHFLAPLPAGYFPRNESPFISILTAVPTSLSSKASATLGSAITSCHFAIGSWLVTMMERAPARSSMISRMSC